MDNGLQVLICQVEHVEVLQLVTSLGHVNPHASTNAVEIAKIIVHGLAFNGTFIEDGLSDLREAVRVATAAGFPDKKELLVIGVAPHVRGEGIIVCTERAIAVKNFLLANGVPAQNVVADAISPYLTT
jgi:hypothetical protein